MEKPFDQEQVKKLVRESLKFPQKVEEKKTLYFRKEGIVLAVTRDDIVYAESIQHVIYIHITNTDVLKLPYLTMKQFEDEVNSPDLIRCSRNAIVNKKFIENIDISNCLICLKDGFGQVEIGITYKKYLREKIKVL